MSTGLLLFPGLGRRNERTQANRGCEGKRRHRNRFGVRCRSRRRHGGMVVRFVATAGSGCRAATLARFQTHLGLSEVVEGVRIIDLTFVAQRGQERASVKTRRF